MSQLSAPTRVTVIGSGGTVIFGMRGHIGEVSHPVTAPARHAIEVLESLRNRARSSAAPPEGGDR